MFASFHPVPSRSAKIQKVMEKGVVKTIEYLALYKICTFCKFQLTFCKFSCTFCKVQLTFCKVQLTFCKCF